MPIYSGNEFVGVVGAANQVEQDVQQLSNQSQHINEIIDVIKNITSQTGLLALNASIEIVLETTMRVREAMALTTKEIASDAESAKQAST